MTEHSYSIHVTPSASMLEELKVLFPGGPCMPHHWEVINALCDAFWRDLERIIHLRQMAAMSGAMRWQWSQEFKIVSETRIRAL